MLDFNKVYKERGEHYIQDLLAVWERSSQVNHDHTATLEERWAHFLRVTEPANALAA